MAIACVMGLGPSLLFLAPVIAMVGLVLFAKIRNHGEEDDVVMPGDPFAEPGADGGAALDAERELEPVA
jgi:hypothetical protein